MDEQQLQQLLMLYVLQNAPGSSRSQKLNYAQDLMKAQGVDLFGTGAPAEFVPSEDMPVNEVEAVWGADPGMQALMDFIRVDGLSPRDAVVEARKQGLIPKGTPSDPDEVNYLGLASDFAKGELKRSQYESKLVGERAKFEAERTPGLGSLTEQTVFQQMGEPSVDMLVRQYAARRNPELQKPAGQAAPYVPLKNGRKPGQDKSLENMYGEAAYYRGQPEARKREQAVVRGEFSSNPMIEKFAQGEARGDVSRILDRSKQRYVVSPDSEKVMNTLAMLNLLGGAK